MIKKCWRGWTSVLLVAWTVRKSNAQNLDYFRNQAAGMDSSQRDRPPL